MEHDRREGRASGRIGWTRVGLPLAVLALGVAGAVVILASHPPSARRPSPETARLVRTVSVELTAVPLVVRAEGTVRARSESELVPEVSGRVSWVSPSLRPGGFFEPSDVLLQIDSSDYDVAARRSEAQLERALGELQLAERNLTRQEGLIRRDVSSEALLDDTRARARVSRAAVVDARAALDRARHDLERTELRAAFAGRVLEETVDVGQFVSRGTRVARLYAIDFAEIRLPIPDAELAFLDLPLDYRGAGRGSERGSEQRSEQAVARDGAGPQVRLRARFAGRDHAWQGRVVRTEGQIDPATRMVHVVVEVPDPYGRGADAERPPLAVGLFVEADIRGRVVEDVAVLPRLALRGEDRVWLVDADGRMRSREIDVLRTERERVLVAGGLEVGEQVIVSPLSTPVEGMRVQIFRPGDESASALVQEP